MVQRVMTWGGLTFLLFFIAFRPDIAAGVFRTLGGGVMDIAQGIGQFFVSLVA